MLSTTTFESSEKIKVKKHFQLFGSVHCMTATIVVAQSRKCHRGTRNDSIPESFNLSFFLKKLLYVYNDHIIDSILIIKSPYLVNCELYNDRIKYSFFSLRGLTKNKIHIKLVHNVSFWVPVLQYTLWFAPRLNLLTEWVKSVKTPHSSSF